MTMAPGKDTATGWPSAFTQAESSFLGGNAVGERDLPLSILHINGGLVIRPRQPDQVPVKAQPLTDREREVLRLLAGGYANRDIADALHLAPGTVKNHVSKVLMKLGVRDRTQAILRALHVGLLTEGERRGPSR
jgi:DNA-binding NarL/FixJ family response regulator